LKLSVTRVLVRALMLAVNEPSIVDIVSERRITFIGILMQGD
jgi:hypothetical protein